MSSESRAEDTREEQNTTEGNRTPNGTNQGDSNAQELGTITSTSAQPSDSGGRKAEDKSNRKLKRWARWSLAAFSMATEVTSFAVTTAYKKNPSKLILGQVSVGFKLASIAQLWIKLVVQYLTNEMSYDDTHGSVASAIHLTMHLVDTISTSQMISQNQEMLETASKSAALVHSRKALFYLSIFVCVGWMLYTIWACAVRYINRKKAANVVA